jgi:hypothetical protein
MSRSNPTVNNPNPSERWFEWKGADGKLVHFDKESKENVDVKLPFSFLVLDQLSMVVGYNKKLKTGIHSNEVRDVRVDPLSVKFFKGETIAEGLWSNIKEKVNYKQGAFAISCYIAFKDGDAMKIGNIRFSGCALGPWIEFRNDNQEAINKKAIVMQVGKTDDSGAVTFTPPVFDSKDISEESNAKAIELDKKLQGFLEGYLKRTHQQGTDKLPGEEDYSQERPESEGTPTDREPVTEPDEDSIPF